MHNLSNSLLIEAYEYAKHLKLDQDFIKLLEKEIEQRSGLKTFDYF